MANKKGTQVQHTIITLHRRGYGIRRIARELGISRNTVRDYVRGHEDQKQIDPPVLTGSDDGRRDLSVSASSQTDPPVLTGDALHTDGGGVEPDPLVHTGSNVQTQSKCEPFRLFIEEALERGLHAVRIHQDLVELHGFTGAYASVQRFVRNLSTGHPVPFRRMETEPGEEAQIDFGRGAWVIADGKRRRPWLFRIVLSHSRKAYSEAVWRQDTETFIRVLENAFRHFGGVTAKLVPDNLKAAVKKADWFDPEITPKVASFCEYYDTVMMPTKPRMPHLKGKIERGIDYAQENALRGRSFESLTAQNRFLQAWEANIADTRIHGTTRRQVRQAFEAERPHLQPLPPFLFPCFQEDFRKVHLDGHIEVENAYYSVPPEFTGRRVMVRWDGQVVRVFDPRDLAQVRIHPRMEPGRFSTNDADIPPRKRCQVERGEHFLLKKMALIDPGVEEWGKHMLKARGLPGVRVLQGAISLSAKHPATSVAHACREAVRLQMWTLRELRTLAQQAPQSQQPELPLHQEHELIRPITDYAVAAMMPQ